MFEFCTAYCIYRFPITDDRLKELYKKQASSFHVIDVGGSTLEASRERSVVQDGGAAAARWGEQNPACIKSDAVQTRGGVGVEQDSVCTTRGVVQTSDELCGHRVLLREQEWPRCTV